MNKPYFENRREKIITEGYGKYRMEIRYMENCNKAQVTMRDISLLRFDLLWSVCMDDEQALSALEIFRQVGYFEVA